MSDLTNNVRISRDEIRNQIIAYMEDYLELENIDLTKSSFLSFMVNVISTLTSNLMFYQTSIYKEFFLTKAQLPESILNLAAFLGYSPSLAKYALTDVMLTFPLTFEDPNVEFTLVSGFDFKTGDGINFITDYKTKVVITNNTTVRVQIAENQRTRDIPVYIDTDANTFSFLLPVKQYQLGSQEFQIPEDTPEYQFIYIDVPFEHQVSEIVVKIIEPGNPDNIYDIYSKYDSVYLMGSDDKGFVARKTSFGYRIYFGNGIMGVQPTPGSKVIIESHETRGKSGNIISGAINKGKSIYITKTSGEVEIVKYEVTNPSPAFYGEDEEPIESTRSNSIDSLTTLHRLVSENDYKNLNVVAYGSPVAANSLPVLKRSDVKNNEIQIFSTFNFQNEIVPARNASLTIVDSTTYIPRNTIINIDGEDFITLFDMNVDTLNKSTYYHYIIHGIEQVPIPEAGYNEDYGLFSDRVKIYRDGSAAKIEIYYSSLETDLNKLSCTMEIAISGVTYNMVHEESNKVFKITIDPYTLLPENNNKYYFTFSHTDLGLISQYSTELTFRKNLDDMMMSNTTLDSTSITIYDIPVVQKEYYDNIDQYTFELQIMQKMLDTLDFTSYKMLTDFANLKFTNTIGKMKNMLYNKTTRLPVLDYDMSAIPIVVSEGDRYIVSGDERHEWEGKKDQIATCIDATNVTWSFTIPVMDDTVYIESQGKNFIYTESGWIPAEFTIPLKIKLHVIKSADYGGSLTQLIDAIKNTLYEKFKDRFGANVTLFRSEIVKEVQLVEGVGHCSLVKPESSIYFNFDIDNFTEEQLLLYSPEYVYFTKDDIDVTILSGEM